MGIGPLICSTSGPTGRKCFLFCQINEFFSLTRDSHSSSRDPDRHVPSALVYALVPVRQVFKLAHLVLPLPVVIDQSI